MPKQVYVESRDQTIEVPDDFTPEEIQNAIATSFSDGQDIAFDLQKFQEAGGNTKDFIAGISDEDYIKLNNFRSDKKMTAAEMGGIALDAAGTLVKDVLKGAYAAGKTMVEAPAKGDNLATAKVLSSAARGVGAGTIDLAQLGLKLLDPTKRIPTFDEFAKQPVTDYGYAYGPAPSVTSRAATPDDYKNLIDSERKKELAALEMVEAADKLVQGAALEDVAKGARFIDAFTITGLAKGLAKGVGKGIAKKGFYEATTGIPAAGAAAPGKVSQTAAKVAEVLGKAPAAATFAGAKAAEVAAKGVKIPLDVARKLAENEVVRGALGAGIGYSQGDIKGAVTGLTAATIGTAVASKLLEGTIAGSQFIGTAAKGALNSASRTGFVEQMLKNPKVSPSVRKIANALLPLQPAFQFAGQVAKETAKDFIPAAVVGAGLGYLADGEEGAAAGVGSALGVSAMTGPIKASVSAVKTLAKAPTARGDANALGDIKTFVNAIPDEKSRIEYAQIMDQAIKVAGPERAADMLDALRLAEAHGATVVVGPKDSPNSFSSIGNIISVNPSKLNSGTVFHETVHQLVNVGIRASLLPELRNLYDGIRDADGNILKQGLYTEADWAAKAKELAESYKNNPIGYKMALDYANKLDNPAGYSPEAIQEAKDFVLDEATASYAERLMGRSRPGAFNPDRLPMWHRNLLEQIDNRVLDNLATELYSGQTNLNTPSKAFTDANGRPVRIPQLDVILRKALSGKYPKSGGAMPKQAAPKTVPIPKNPVDVAKFAQATFGATRDILGTDENGNPRLLTEKEHQAVAKADYEAAVQAFQQLSPDDQATVRLVNRKGEPASITDKDYQIQITSATPAPVFERFLQVAKDRGMGNQQLATMRQLYASMVSPEGPTFDTVNNPVWKYSKRTGQMESTVRPPTRQEIYPLFIHVNSAGGFNVKYIDLSRLKQNAQKIMSNPKHTGIWPSMDAFMDDFKRSMRNLSAEGKQPDTPSGSKSTAELLGNGDENLGAVKRDLIAEALNVTLPERLKSKGYENEPVFEPLSLIGKEKRGKRIGESAFRDFRIERVTEITPTKERLKVVQENAYDKLVRRFQPDSFTPETLPNGEALTNPDGYRILKKTGSSLFRVYDREGKLLGVESSDVKAMSKAQSDFAKKEQKTRSTIMRFQYVGESAEMSTFMRDSLDTAKSMASKGVPSETIRAITGWFPGKFDDKMRWEIPDNEVTIRLPEYRSLRSNGEDARTIVSSFVYNLQKQRFSDATERVKGFDAKSLLAESKRIQTLTDQENIRLRDFYAGEANPNRINNRVPLFYLLDHPKLFEAYPDAAWIPVGFSVADVDPFADGQFNRSSNVIGINPLMITNDSIVSTVLHEVQHWIQKKEGFAKGSNYDAESPYNFDDLESENKKYASALRKLIQEHEAKGGSAKTALNSEYGKVLSDSLTLIQDAIKKAKEGYKRSAGEIEARDVQARQYFTPEQRKAIAPYSSENIAKDEAIVRFQPITPEQDAAYLSAVKAGDTAKAQAMVDEVVRSRLPRHSINLSKPLTVDQEIIIGDLRFVVERAAISKSGLGGIRLELKGEKGTAFETRFGKGGGRLVAQETILEPKSRGRGVSLVMYAWANAESRRKGFDGIESDTKRTDEAEFVWKSLAKRGLAYPEGSGGERVKLKKGATFVFERGDHGSFKSLIWRFRSTDPVTYDNSGNVIPLSQRFNPGSNDIRFQPITPEQDAAYINAVKSGDSETVQRMVEQATKNAAPSKSVILYRGLEKPFDPNYDPNMRDSPSGYSTWTDNPLLARQYAGEDGSVYAIFVPKSEVKSDYINVDGDRSFVFPTGKAAGLNNVSGKEFLLYEDHDLFSPSQIKSVDPVTYDDAGNLIPLSQRFNPNSSDIRFQSDEGQPNASSINFDQKGLDDSPIRSILGGALQFNPNKVNEKYYTEATKAAKAYGAGSDFIQSRQSEVSRQVRDQMDRLRSEKLRSDEAILQQFIDAFPSHKVKEGGEHYTYIPDDGDFVLKLTKPSDESGVGFVGLSIDEDVGQGFAQKEFRRLGFRPAAVSEYIARTANFSKLFGIPWQVTEIVQNKLGQPVIVSLMKKIEGDALTRDKADLKAVNDYMAKRGFKPLIEGPMTYHKNYEHIPESTYYNPNTGQLISDADPRNFVRTKSGKIEPVDLLINVFNPKYEIRFQPDPSMPSVLNGSNGTRIIKSNSGKFRVYSVTGALLGIRDTQQAAEKLAAKP